MTKLESLPVYERLSKLADPIDESGQRRFLNLSRDTILKMGLKADTKPSSLTIPILGVLTGYKYPGQIAQVVDSAEKVLPDDPEQLDLSRVPSNAVVRIGFQELAEEVDNYFGNFHNDVINRASRLGIFTVLYSIDHAEAIRRSA